MAYFEVNNYYLKSKIIVSTKLKLATSENIGDEILM